MKAVLAHLVIKRNECMLVDLEAVAEHLGCGTVTYVDGLAVVTEPSKRSLNTMIEVNALARDLGLNKQAFIVNRFVNEAPPVNHFFFISSTKAAILSDSSLSRSGSASS